MDESPLPAAHARPVVLVVDDRADNVRVVGQLLVEAGLEVVPAMSGQEAIALASADPPDLVLLDMRMPGMDGFQVLKALQEKASTQDVPVIFLTADIERESLIRAFAAGAVDYLIKPFVRNELLMRVRTHIELKQSRDALRRIASEKQRMAETVAHDLRNHFANILFAADMLRKDDLSLEARLRLIDSISVSGDSGVLFLQAFLDQQSADVQHSRLESLPLPELLQAVVALFEHQAQGKSITVRIELTGTVGAVFGQRAGSMHVLQNMLSNALKYSPTDSEVSIMATRRDRRARISVLDRGPGISEPDQARLFQRYVKLAAQPTQGEVSTGLGLALAKQHARAMGGELWYERREGGGSIFHFELPLG